MSAFEPVVKDDMNQRPVPSAWRGVFSDIVHAIKNGDLSLVGSINGVTAVSSEKASKITASIKNYGANLVDLSEETWSTSVCQWMGNRWDVLIDLYTVEEGASDLVLEARVYEKDTDHIFEVHFVCVP
ncbi:hypothetical protein AAKU61_001409 [Undibacterium sp. GrIS 1.2]|uniref:DUF7668 domain-containing protein n=1 Tax=Undibacterium sp. GrIS 1.2 TaxID=3143933 RepID=UPI00339473E3